MMKKLIVLLAFTLVVFSNFFAQQSKIDSLRQVINSTSQDTIRIKTYLRLGDIYEYTVPDTALFYYKEALAIAEENKENRLIAKSANYIGNIYKNKSNYPKALEYYMKSMNISEHINDNRAVAINLGNMGNVYSYQSKYLRSLECFEKAIVINKRISRKAGIASNYGSMGNIYLIQNDHQKALEYFQKALKMEKEIGRKVGEAVNFSRLGMLFMNQDNYLEALNYYKKALKINQEIGRKLGVANVLSAIGGVYRVQKNYPTALEFYKKSLQLNLKIGHKSGVAGNMSSLGIVYGLQNNSQKALEYLQKALKINEEIGRLSGVANGYGNIGVIYKKQRKYVYALTYLEKSLKLNTQLKKSSGIATNLLNIGAVYFKQMNFPKSLEYHFKSMKIDEEIGSRTGVGINLEGIGDVYNKKKEYLKALSHFNEALKNTKEIGVESASIYRRLFTSNWALNNPKTSSDCLDTMLNINNKAVLLNFAILPESAKQLYFSGVEKDYWRYNSFVLANRDSFPKMNGRVYNATVKNKGLLLKSNTAMRNAIYSSKDSTLMESYENWIVLKTQIAKKYANGEDATALVNNADSLEGNLVKNSNEFSDFKKTQNIDWKQVQNGLEENEVAIEFTHFPLLNPDSSFTDFTNEVQYVALLIDKNSEYPEMIPLFKEKQLEEILGKLAGNNYSYINEVYGTHSKENKVLYNLIWKPIEKQVQGAKKVFLSPSGLLHKVSFSAIAKSQNIYLCDAYDIEIKSSTGKIIDRENQRQELNTASLFGGVNYDTENTDQKIWKYLDGTKAEADNINKILNKGKLEVNYFSSTAATEAKFKETSSSANILHIATHGFFYPDPNKVQEEAEKNTEYGDITFRGNQGYGVNSFVESRNPLMRSGLALAGANDVWSQQVKNDSIEDGVLTAEEVSNIDLRKTELVVMSACESGLGDIQGSEGVYGLQRSFKMAGVDFIIMSLWQVPDKETEEFMTIFYKNLTKKKDIKKAFSKTQKVMRKKYDPYFWAAFVLVE